VGVDRGAGQAAGLPLEFTQLEVDLVGRVEFVDQIPKSASGKILRRMLVERDRAAPGAR
jgi:acyl-coenzyme A synthetase/AMP-(fatty) acid ligase